jgi:hypothetical protein
MQDEGLASLTDAALADPALELMRWRGAVTAEPWFGSETPAAASMSALAGSGLAQQPKADTRDTQPGSAAFSGRSAPPSSRWLNSKWSIASPKGSIDPSAAELIRRDVEGTADDLDA